MTNISNQRGDITKHFKDSKRIIKNVIFKNNFMPTNSRT